MMPPDTYTIEEILTEIPGTDDGIGSDVSLTSVYDDIKHARFEEDNGLSLGVWERDLKKADWKLVEKLTIDALKNQTKDLQILVWFIESVVVLQGFSGIPSAIEFLRSFLESFWSSCYPKAEDSDPEYKFRILDWLYETVAKRMLYFPFVKVGHTSDTEINLYQYEYALEMQARQARSPSKASEIANSAKRNDIKTIDEINGILAQIKADEAIGFCDLSSQIKEAVKNLAQTISKISEEKSFGVFLNLTANLGKIEGVLHKHIPNGAEIPNKNDDSPRSDDQAIFIETDREKLYARLIQIKQELMAADRHSPSHCLLELIVSWQNKTLLDIINDLKEGNTPAHQLLRILMS